MLPARRRQLVWGALLVALVSIAYAPALRASWIWDDDAHVTDNPTLRAPGGLSRIWFEPDALPQYYPLVHTTFWVEYRLWGDAPLGYHLVNVLIHSASALLLWQLLRRLSVPGAWLAAAAFALHPLQVESVAWVTERKNVLSALFFLGAFHALVGYFALDRPPAGPAPRRPGLYIVGAGLFLAAMLSKTVSASLPVVVALSIWWKRGRIARPEVWALAPLAGVGAAMGLFTAWMEKHHVGAEGAEWALGFLERGLLAGRVLWFYVGKLLWPVDLVFVYPRWQIDARVPWQYVFPVAAAAVVVALSLLRRRLGRGPLVAVLTYAVVLFPALGFFDVYPMRYSFVADHFQYHAGAALIALFVAAAAVALANAPAAVRVTCAAVLLSVLAGLTWTRVGAYRDEEALWRDTLARNPGAWMAHNNLGELLVRRGRVDEGIGHYREAIRLKPDHAKAHSNLGAALASRGELAEAADLLDRAKRLRPEHPGIRYNAGILALQLGKPDEAERELRETVRLEPRHARAHELLANVLASRGELEEAVMHYERALQVEPGLAGARFNLAATLSRLGRTDEARRQLELLLRDRPEDRGARELLRRLGGRPH